MAAIFQETFGEMLVSAPLDKNEACLPSPERLRRKIILKHKKLPEGADEAGHSKQPLVDSVSVVSLVSVDSQSQLSQQQAGTDIGNSVHNGTLYLRDQGTECFDRMSFAL